MLKTWRNNFEWGGGGGSLFYLTDLWLAAIWSKTGCSFRESVSTFLLLVGALATTTATATRASKKQQVYHAKQQLCTCITLVCTPLYRPCTTTTWKCLIVSFMEDINKRRRISFSLSKKSTPGKFAYTCHFQQIGTNATKIEKTGIHFKSDGFAAVAVVDAKAPY